MMDNSDNVVSLPDMKDVEAQAAGWIMRFEDGDASDQDYAAFQAWQNTSEHHRNAFERLAGLWGALDIVEELNDYAAADDSVLLIEENARPRWRSFARRSVLSAFAASFALIVGTVVAFDVFQGHHQGVYQTAIGERKLVNLPDGSIIELNTNSLVEVNYSRSTRDIHLIRGEAYFDVAANKDRPFSVYAGKGVVTAVGTAFTVHLRDKTIEVLVSEGRVSLASIPVNKEMSGADFNQEILIEPLLEITAGQHAVFEDEIKQLAYLEEKVLDRRLAWREGILVFVGEPLSNVVESISRYTDITIEIEDSELRDLPIAGNFKVGEVEAMFEAISIMTNVQIERVSSKYVRLSIKDQG